MADSLYEQLENARKLVELADTIPNYVGCPGYEHKKVLIGRYALEIAMARLLLKRHTQEKDHG